ncbi:MAG: hypothetical protein ABIJ42_05135 [Acidobacteriota bacterium]
MKRITLCFLLLVLMPLLMTPLLSQGPDEYKIQLMKHLRDGRINESLILSIIALKDYPDDPIFQLIGNNPDPAELLFLTPTPEQARNGYGNILDFADILIELDSKYAMAGLELYKKIKAYNPDKNEINYRYARHLFRSGDSRKRKEAYELASAAADNSSSEGSVTESRKFKSILDLIAGGELLAPGDFYSSYTEFSMDTAILEELARNALNNKTCSDAVEYLRMSITIDPWKPELQQLQAEAFSCLGNQEQAEAAKTLSDRLFRNEEIFNTLFGKLLTGHSEEAVHGLELLLAEHPGFLDGVRLLARLYSGEGKKIEAVAVYRNYLQVFPDDTRIRDLAARMLLDEGLYDQASSLMMQNSVTETGRLISAYQIDGQGK